MRMSSMMPAIWGLVGLLLILGAVVFWLQPATSNLDQELVTAGEKEKAFADERARRVGTMYVTDLSTARREADQALRSVTEDLENQSALLDAWFSGLAIGENGTPARDKFRDRYTFYQDELRRELAGIARTRGRASDIEIPLHQPEFLVQKREPNDESEMRSAQRVANIERLLLRAAARGSAFPRNPIEIRRGFTAPSEGSKFSEARVVIHLELPAQRLHDALKSLCELDGEGPIVRLEALDTRPRPLPKRIEENQP
ncbi:MAG: hypothetical protein CMJ83_05625, partial [Planctomycetes bacterium]|nr:hypothetical protein [Planctomycetota bacterium]